jgi:hypothetical protein
MLRLSCSLIGYMRDSMIADPYSLFARSKEHEYGQGTDEWFGQFTTLH